MIRLDLHRLEPTTAKPDGGWRVAVVVGTDGIPGREDTGKPLQLCSGAGDTKEIAAGWALHHLRRIFEEGNALLVNFGAEMKP